MPAVAHNDLKINATHLCVKRQILYRDHPEAEEREQDTTWLHYNRNDVHIAVQRILPDIEGVRQLYVRVFYKEENIYTYTNIADSEHFSNYWNGMSSGDIESVVYGIQNLEI